MVTLELLLDDEHSIFNNVTGVIVRDIDKRIERLKKYGTLLEKVGENSRIPDYKSRIAETYNLAVVRWIELETAKNMGAKTILIILLGEERHSIYYLNHIPYDAATEIVRAMKNARYIRIEDKEKWMILIEYNR